MPIVIRARRIATTRKPWLRSYIHKEVFDGRRTCADPCGVLRGTCYELWLRPLRLLLKLGRTRVFHSPTEIAGRWRALISWSFARNFLSRSASASNGSSPGPWNLGYPME